MSVKNEYLTSCCCCLNDKDLINILDFCDLEGKLEILTSIIEKCFQINFKKLLEDNEDQYVYICKNCMHHLKDVNILRYQIQKAYNIQNFKSEQTEDICIKTEVKEEIELKCCCCFNTEDLFDLQSSHVYNDKVEIYANMIGECFGLRKQISDNLICKNCIYILRDAVSLKLQLQSTYDCTKEVCDSKSNLCVGESFTTHSLLRKEIKKSNELRVIKRINSDVRKFTCTICHKGFKRKMDLKNHEISHEKSRFEISKNASPSKSNLLTHSHLKNFVCDMCQKSFTSKSHLKLHFLTHNKIKNEVCEICKKAFLTKANVKQHMVTHSDLRNFTCDVCQKTFARKSHLKLHFLIHNKVKNEICKICKKAFLTKAEVKKHMICHTDFKKFDCDVCRKSFKRRGDLNRHIKRHAKIKNEECGVCNKSFTNKSSLKKHMMCHSNVRNYICDICQKDFVRKSDIYQHMMIHIGCKIIKCNVCKRSFSNRSKLKIHMTSHSGMKNFICDICNKHFITKGDIYRHIIIHMDLKTVECDICKKGFFTKSEIRKHMICHTDLRNFFCDICDRKFKTNNVLLKHKQLHLESNETVLKLGTYRKPRCLDALKEKSFMFNHMIAIDKNESVKRDPEFIKIKVPVKTYRKKVVADCGVIM